MEKNTYTIHTLNKLDTFARRMSLKVTFISFEENISENWILCISLKLSDALNINVHFNNKMFIVKH